MDDCRLQNSVCGCQPSFRGMITISTAGQTLTCKTPYHPDFPRAARDLGGKWKDPAWVFDARDAQRVRDLCLDIWGTDGTPCELVTLRVVLAGAAIDRAGNDTEIYIGGRRCAWVFGRDDQRARLGDGVVLVAGRVFGSGSRNNPDISWSEGATVEVRDIPAEMAANVRARAPELVEILDSPVSPDVPEANPAVQALMAERAKLTARLTEIDRELLALAPARRDIPLYEVADELRDND